MSQSLRYVLPTLLVHLKSLLTDVYKSFNHGDEKVDITVVKYVSGDLLIIYIILIQCAFSDLHLNALLLNFIHEWGELTDTVEVLLFWNVLYELHLCQFIGWVVLLIWA